MFENERKNSGAGGLVGVAALLVSWLAVAAVMWSAYLAPQIREPERCQLVCRQASLPAKG